jgi:hypothetical protein
MCSKSNPLVVFALDLMSAYEGEHTIFGLLGQANLTQNDVLQFVFLWEQRQTVRWASYLSDILIINFIWHYGMK